MTNSGSGIQKSKGVTRTEKLLAKLCENTFLRLWSYPNPCKENGKEICDLLVVFEDNVFIFFDRESRRFDGANKNTLTSWSRWKKEAIDKQITTAKGAERYIRSGYPIFLDDKAKIPFPIPINDDSRIYKIVVAHGAGEACAAFSDQNVSGSLAISYGVKGLEFDFPFSIDLDKNDIVHVLDSDNIKIIFQELDTVFDFVSYFSEKESAIRNVEFITYCGEEDLLAHYMVNYNKKKNRYQIGFPDKSYDALHIREGEWKDFEKSAIYTRRAKANEASYFWDNLIQRTCQNALDGTIQGEANILAGPSALHEMAREPRFSRRALSEGMISSITNFPDSNDPVVRNVSFMPSFYKGVGYVFLQLKVINKGSYETEYRPKRQAMLEIACGAAKNKFSHLKKIIGIAIDAPKYSSINSEDFCLMICENWSEDETIRFHEANSLFDFFQSPNLKKTIKRSRDFPVSEPYKKNRKVGRNELCPCGSMKKHKKCCIGRY